MLFPVSSYSDNKTLSVAIPNDGYAPYIIIENNRIFGILVEPLQLAAENIGVKLTYKFLPEKRSFEMLNRNLVNARMESSLYEKIDE